MNVFIFIMLNIFNASLLVSMDTAVSLEYNIILVYSLFTAAKPRMKSG